jgi:hypothetical protein
VARGVSVSESRKKRFGPLAASGFFYFPEIVFAKRFEEIERNEDRENN